MLPPIPLPCLTGFLLLASKKPQKSAVARSPPQLIVNQQKTETYYLIMRHDTSKGTLRWPSSHTTPHKLSPTPRANPFPKVTDPFCRLPLPTLFHRPEAVNLGDLLRLLVRSGEKSVYYLLFPLDFQGSSKAHQTSQNKEMLCRPSSPFSGKSDSRAIQFE